MMQKCKTTFKKSETSKNVLAIEVYSERYESDENYKNKIDNQLKKYYEFKCNNT